MKKYILLSLFIFFVSNNFPQSLKIGFGGGFSNILSPDSYKKDISSNGMGFSNEYHFGLKAKVSLPLIPFTPIGFIQYHLLNGEGSIAGGTVETSQSIFSLGAGAELVFIPGPLSPFFSIDIAYNNFSNLEYESTSPGGSTSVSGNSRIGFGIGAGIEFSLLPVDLEVCAKYQFMNLIGRESKEESINLLTVGLFIYL